MNRLTGCIKSGGVGMILAMSLLCPALLRAQAIVAVEVVEPRSFGYVIGDTLRRDVHLSLDAGYRLDDASLPKPGKVDRWLELAAPEVRVEPREDGSRYHMIFTYRIMNVPRQLGAITLPQLDFGFTDGTQHQTALVPARVITAAPITPGPDALRPSSLQPDRPPVPIPVAARERRLAGTVAGLVLLLAFAAVRHWVTPMLGAGRLPFSTAVRKLKRVERGPVTPAQYASGLKIVHEAINETAGRAVFAHNLDEFLAAHPRYAGLGPELARLFAASGNVFFAGAEDARHAGVSLADLRLLCRRCSRIERSSPGPRA